MLEELESKHEAAFLEMAADFFNNDRDTFVELFARNTPWTPNEFKFYLRECSRERRDWRPGAKDISITRYVYFHEDSPEIFGFGVMRFPLTESVEATGGNLRFVTVPAKRGKGHEVFILNALLFEAHRAGLARALVTCLATDEVAINAIQLNRGELEGGTDRLRYWIHFR